MNTINRSFMRYWVVTVFSVLALCMSIILSAASASPPSHLQWVPIPELSDEFNGTKLDTDKWLDYHPYWSGRDISYFAKENISVSGGNRCLIF